MTKKDFYMLGSIYLISKLIGVGMNSLVRTNGSSKVIWFHKTQLDTGWVLCYYRRMNTISTNWAKLQSDRELNARNRAFELFKTCTRFSTLYEASEFNKKKLKWLEQESDDMSMYSTLPDPALRAIVKMVVKDVSKQSSLHEKVVEDRLNQFLSMSLYDSQPV